MDGIEVVENSSSGSTDIQGVHQKPTLQTGETRRSVEDWLRMLSTEERSAAFLIKDKVF
eukprot:CAMPEP_0116570824 /NCGR_PEP_ID=MMETSP0397-20121206/17184_1 /TAXON_ID=216820 /ORGANISM="Cyclophora tenuis, Strain ECT3854" /LENGTH=58 /DNA_ID=CAMNT_0004098783 /DNA_START=218 /DNA_END=391 /DNA_ORIENTATION=+